MIDCFENLFSSFVSFIARKVVCYLCFVSFYLNKNEVFLFSQFNFSVKDIFHERAWLMSSVFSVQVSGYSLICVYSLL